jgi:NAD(P)-dependent dehydrogenase (short-subunit alcohol dehydrogenase family)
VLFAVQLDALARERGVRAFALHPGGILTPLQRHLEKSEMIERGWIDEDGNVLNPGMFKSPQEGAATQVWAATSPQLDGLGGVYLEDCDIAEPAGAEGVRGGVRDYAVDPAQAARLWALSAELTGVDAFAA